MSTYEIFDRIPEAELHTEKEDSIFCEYKSLVGPDRDIESCIELLSDSMLNKKGNGLQIIDLGGADGLFVYNFYLRLPQALYVCIDKSSTMIALAEKKYKNIPTLSFVNDDLINTWKYIDFSKETLITCRGTIHHLPSLEYIHDLIKSLPQSVGIFLKDIIRPKTFIDLQESCKRILGLATGLNMKDDVFIKTIKKLTVQSLFSSYTKEEILLCFRDIPTLSYGEDQQNTYFEVTRHVGD